MEMLLEDKEKILNKTNGLALHAELHSNET